MWFPPTLAFPDEFVGARAAQKAGIPYIHTEHGSNFVNNSNPIIAIGSRVVDLSLGRYITTHAAQVLGVSEAAANFAGRLGAKDPQVFYNAINLPETSYSGPQRPNHLVFIGRMVEGKGWETYLRCLAQLRGAGQQLTGQMLGDGAQLQAARDLAAQLKLDDVVDTPRARHPSPGTPSHCWSHSSKPHGLV